METPRKGPAALHQERRPHRARAELRRLPRRRPHQRRSRCLHEQGQGLQGQAGARRHPQVLRAVPQQPRTDAEVRAARARGSVRALPDQRSRKAPGGRRHQRRHLHRLPQRARHPRGQGQPVAGPSAARRRDLLALPLRRAEDGAGTRFPPTSSRNTRPASTGRLMAKRGDLSAPSCASCHGNHGAKPPQVESVADVCGSCHVLFAQLYDKSVHKPSSPAPAAAGDAWSATRTTASTSLRPRCWPGRRRSARDATRRTSPPGKAASRWPAGSTDWMRP